MRLRVRRDLKGCNFQMAKAIITKQFSGKVIPNDLALLLDRYISNPTIETAVDLVLFDSALIAYFELSRSRGFTESMFRQED